MNIFLSALLGLALLQSPSVQHQLGKASMYDAGMVTSGMILFIDAGSCPTGYTEVSQSGNYVLFTSSANGDVGTNGGSNSYTPAGINSAPTFTGSQGTTSAVSAGTPAGTNSTATVATVTGSKAGTNAGAFSTIGGVSPGSSFTVPAETFTGSALATHTHTLTPTGTIAAPTFTGTQATIQPTFYKLIGCKKT